RCAPAPALYHPCSLNAPTSPELSPLSLHDALPIFQDARTTAEHLAAALNDSADRIVVCSTGLIGERLPMPKLLAGVDAAVAEARSEEHTSELQSRENLVCRLLLEKKKKKPINPHTR